MHIHSPRSWPSASGPEKSWGNHANGDEGDFDHSIPTWSACAAMRSARKPGSLLVDTNREMVEQISTSLDDLAIGRELWKLGLYSWLRATYTTMTTRSIYGLMSRYCPAFISNLKIGKTLQMRHRYEV